MYRWLRYNLYHAAFASDRLGAGQRAIVDAPTGPPLRCRMHFMVVAGAAAIAGSVLAMTAPHSSLVRYLVHLIFRLPSHAQMRTIGLTGLAMVAFAANSVLCRVALSEAAIDPATFTIVRLASGTCVLWLILLVTQKVKKPGGSWLASVALFAYAAAFSFAYVSVPAGAGALLLFGAVQATMVTYGLFRGERLSSLQWLGLTIAIAGLAVLVAPGASAPSLKGACLMLTAGVAWGVYSVLGRGTADPLDATAGNFLRARTNCSLSFFLRCIV